MPISNANVEKDFDNKMLKRREMLVSLEFEGATPSREEIKRFRLKWTGGRLLRSWPSLIVSASTCWRAEP